MERKLSTSRLLCVEGDRVPPFKFYRTQVAKSRMATTQIVEAFDVEENVVARRPVRSVGLILDKFGLERCPEALHQSVIVTVAGATHIHWSWLRPSPTQLLSEKRCP